MSAGRYVGVDLGTTNCTVAVQDAEGTPQTLDIEQVSAPGERMALPRLPSFLYAPTEGEGGFDLPFDTTASGPRFVVGSHAERRGNEVPGRVIQSAKSWLCHGGVDRRAGILPDHGADDVDKISPVNAQERLLKHLAAAYAHSTGTALHDERVVVTVPASFDAVARSLTEDACANAGLGASFSLLEEPQAALYAWLAAHEETWRRELVVGDKILVVDLGGGTTDFSLIEVKDDDGDLALERVAVGEHILLGGDNMDLALAYRVKLRLESAGKTIDERQMRGLIHGARRAKETLFVDASIDEVPVTIPGRGRKLLGSTLSDKISRADVDAAVVQAFFPDCPMDAEPLARRAGLQTLGLPYAADAAVTKHLAKFLRRGDAPVAPTCVLFNGGVTKAEPIRERIMHVLSTWMGQMGEPQPRVLDGFDPDLAVSRGAAYFARARAGEGLRIKGGTAQSYYIGIERAEMAIPGVPPTLDAVCVAPKGMEEGATANLSDQLGLLLGESCSFRFFGSPDRDDEIGARVRPDALRELESIETRLVTDEDNAGQVVPVTLQSNITDVGTLELYCCAVADADKRWKLTFDVRGEA